MSKFEASGRSRRFGALLLISAVVAACAGARPVPSGAVAADGDFVKVNAERAAPSDLAARDSAAAMNAFGFDLYARLGKGNLVYSPASIGLALAMARAGARGETAAQMDAVMHGFASAEKIDLINSLDQSLVAISGKFRDAAGVEMPVSLRIVNTSFAQRGWPIQEQYLKVLSKDFGAGVQLCDYAADPEGARKAVNAWVSRQTEKRIPELVGPGVFDARTRLSLVNAIYLKAPWRSRFYATEAGMTFARADSSPVTVASMRNEGHLSYADGAGWQAMELPYLGGSLAMTIVSPTDLASFEKTLDAARFASIVSGLDSRQVDLEMPMFKLDTTASLRGTLAAMGMPDAFGDRADFSGINPDEKLAISAVIHQANIDVDEKGTEAAAATVVAIAASAATNEKTVKLDRPFIFAVRDTKTGAILFLGRVADPSQR